MKRTERWILVLLAVALLLTLTACKKDTPAPASSTEPTEAGTEETGFADAAREPVTEADLTGAWTMRYEGSVAAYRFGEDGTVQITSAPLDGSGEEKTVEATWALVGNSIQIDPIETAKMPEDRVAVIIALEGQTLFCRRPSDTEKGFVLRRTDGEPTERRLNAFETQLAGDWTSLSDAGDGMMLRLDDTGRCTAEYLEKNEPAGKFEGEWILEQGGLYLSDFSGAEETWIVIRLDALTEASFTGTGSLGEMTFTRGE